MALMIASFISCHLHHPLVLFGLNSRVSPLHANRCHLIKMDFRTISHPATHLVNMLQ